MRVRFRTNVGIHDAAKLGLDFQNCTKGAELEVGDDVVGAVMAFADPVEKPVEIQAVPVVETIEQPVVVTTVVPRKKSKKAT